MPDLCLLNCDFWFTIIDSRTIIKLTVIQIKKKNENRMFQTQNKDSLLLDIKYEQIL